MIIMQPHYKHWMGILAAIFLGVTFIVAGSSKVFTPAVDMELPILFGYIPFYPVELLFAWLMLVEILVGVFLVAGIYVKFAACFSFLLVAGFIGSNILLKIYGHAECLSCFGAMGTLSTTQALYLDGIMVALAVTVLAFYPGRFFNVRPWFWGK